jgi:serine/threonine-protein kinase
MATVFLARDVRHDRPVAVKVLNPALGAVIGVERFLVEIKVTAHLHHPNLLPLFDSGEADGILFYVMPFVVGESLRARLDRERQLPIQDAVHITRAVASALDYAHRHGVIHRDLKPENILLHEGEPLVADFGIALAVSRAAGQRITETGVSLGTPQYMSPEQATAERTLDGRTDIFALGAVLYEMLTGEPPHDGSSTQAIVARVLTEKPRSIRSTRPSVPDHIDNAVATALEKLPADRFATPQAMAAALEEPSAVTSAHRSSAASENGALRVPGSSKGQWIRFLTGFALIAIGAATAAVVQRVRAPGEPPPAPVRFLLNFALGEQLADGTGNPVVISPDGRTLVYAGVRAGGPQRLFVRPLSELRGRELAGTEGAFAPAFSPDGGWIAFVVGEQLKKVPSTGGTPIQLATLTATNVRGMSWASPDAIVVGRNNGSLLIVPAQGGEAKPLSNGGRARGAWDERWPLVLDDGKTVLFVAYRGALASAELWAESVAGDHAGPLGLKGTVPLGVIDGQLLYVAPTGAVMAVRFDAAHRRISGTPVPVVDQVATESGSAYARASVSRNGSLVYQSGSLVSTLVIVGRNGQTRPLLEESQTYSNPRFSPDGRFIAVGIGAGTGTDVWIFDRAARTLARLTSGGGVANDRPEWTPDGKRVLFRSTRDGTSLWSQPADKSAPAELLARIATQQLDEGVFSPDGKTLLYRTASGSISQDIWYRAVAGDTTPRPLIQSAATETGARFSRDGKWIAFSSDESGIREVYVTPFPGPGPRVQISSGGGQEPVWAPHGDELYYVHDQTLMAAALSFAPRVSVTSRTRLFEGSYLFNYLHANYDVSPNGAEFVLTQSAGGSQVVVIHDWRSELRARDRSRGAR